MKKETFTQNTMIIPDRYVKEVYGNTPLDQFRKKLFAPEREKQRVVNFVGYESEVAYAMKTFQNKIDGGHKEREEWLRLHGTENDIQTIQQEIAFAKMRSAPVEEVKRLEREISIVQQRIKALQKETSGNS